MNRDLQSLLDMLQSAEAVLSYMEGVTKSRFYNDEPQLQDAVIRRLTVIGEAANRVSAETQSSLANKRSLNSGERYAQSTGSRI